MGKSLYLSTDRTRVVEDGDPDAGFLLATADDELDSAKLTSEHGEDIAKQAGKLRTASKAKAPAEDKAVKAPPADKEG